VLLFGQTRPCLEHLDLDFHLDLSLFLFAFSS
jgi:hypothetical protein